MKSLTDYICRMAEMWKWKEDEENPFRWIGALLEASKKGHEETVQFLIEKGVNVNDCDADGYTPLMMAVCNNQVKTPLMMAVCNNQVKKTISDDSV